MKKIFVALCMVAFLAACDDSSSASAENNEPTTLSSAEEQGSSSSTKKLTDSSDSRCEECNDEAISSSGNAESSCSEELSETSSSSADKMESSSNSEFLATPCKTETEDNCEYGTVLDDRDGQTYKTVKIGDQWWMAENLNYEMDNSFCYNDSAEYCEKYGRLYTWAAAMDSAGTWSTNGKGCGYDQTCSPTYPVRGVCPEGWHLPDTTEWNALFTAVGGQLTAGKVLKSTSGWYSSGNGTDAYSFSALPAGNRNRHGYFYNDGYNADFWSATEDDSSGAYYMYLGYDSEGAYLHDGYKIYGFSVRCLKD
ncbi:fibrobacter succinogenes major paralogous domain-containing protein [Fibrobacter sp. UWP2]|uniref:fibrobacter succinogenes major paralogous domain-containing protein n=1 Tax=Fibrobacter sp. UWP2 TaxID=1896216 RepID=UPI0009194462|nr:fibrobacter succinogenes major paralogous domain-containing protein [Fibrobacter sp. UWP2]SHI86142.1 major paralogous domain-containing protein [Fibrobacter sp. UWP2]